MDTAARTRELGTALAYPPPKGGLGSHETIIAARETRQNDKKRTTPREGTARPTGLWQAGPTIHKEAAEEEEATVRERAKPCPDCKEEGRLGQFHSGERSYPDWDTPSKIMWPSFMLITCPPFVRFDPAGRAHQCSA